MSLKTIYCIIISLWAASVPSLWGQEQLGKGGQGQREASTTTGPLGIERSEEDTVQLRYITLSDIYNSKKVESVQLEDFEKYASFRRFRTASLTLGNLGSSHQPIIYTPKANIFTDPGFHQYDNYKLDINEFRHYRLGEALNDLYFSPGGGKENFLVKAKFAANFANNNKVSLDLQRISQEGFYRSQGTKSTRFGIGLWKDNSDKNHQLFLTLIANNHNEDHNGGITTVTQPTIRNRSGEGSYLSLADTRHEHLTYALDNFFQLKEGKYQAHHQVKYEHGYYRYSDDVTSTSNDTLRYGDTFISDTRGIRYFMGFNKVHNTIDLSFDTKNFGLKLGASHLYAKYKRDLDNIEINDLIVFGELDAAWNQYAQLRARGELGVGSNAGNLKLDAQALLTPARGFTLKGQLKALRYDPTLIQESLSLTLQPAPIYDNDFDKINEFSLGASLYWDKLNLELEFNSGLIDKPVGYDTLALPYQRDGSTEYVQGILTHRLLFRFVGLENSIVYQSFTDNLYRLPTFYGIHNAFFQLPLFKNQLLTRVGVLYYSMQMDDPLAFFPITGTFIPAKSEASINNLPYYEIYADFKIGDATIFVKLENANDLFYRSVQYQIVDYPQFDWKLRMGVRWRLRG